jgi:hypothetical protein
MDKYWKRFEGKRPWPDWRYYLRIYLDRLRKKKKFFVYDNQVPCHDLNRISLLDPICLALRLYKCIKVRKWFTFIEGFNGFAGSGRNTWRFCKTDVNGTVGVGNLSLSALLVRLKVFQVPWSAGL